MPYDEDIRTNRRARAKVAGYATLTPGQRAGYIAAVIGIVAFALVSAIVFGPVM
jgi:hypothetical protein